LSGQRILNAAALSLDAANTLDVMAANPIVWQRHLWRISDFLDLHLVLALWNKKVDRDCLAVRSYRSFM
jgi:hypothetical protein